MFIFKTSGQTFDSVITNEKHAFCGLPHRWFPNELVLVSKNRVDCKRGEKQIQYIMQLDDIRPLQPGEVQKYWPGNEGRWRYLVLCKNTTRIDRPFDLKDILGENARSYRTVMTFSKIDLEHERIIEDYLRKFGAL